MGELGFNKIFAALLAAVLVIMGLRELTGMVFSTGGSHYDEEYETATAWAKKKFPGYHIEIVEPGSAGTEVVEEVYDLGLLLASADASTGERVYKAQCATCHSIEQGGANGTGPNLYNAIGGEKQHLASFNYSGALNTTDGDWTWENMDAWLENPSRYARGTSMAFAGLRRDDQRAAVLLYLAEYSTKTPPKPEPLSVVMDDATVDEASLEATGAATVIEAVAGESVEAQALEAAATVEAEIVEAVDEAGATAEAAIDAGIEAAEDFMEEVTGE